METSWQRIFARNFTRLDSGLVPVSDAGPSGAGSERGRKAVAAHRLGQDQPEAKQHRDQREAKPQPLLHVRPLPFAMPDQRDISKGQNGGGRL